MLKCRLSRKDQTFLSTSTFCYSSPLPGSIRPELFNYEVPKRHHHLQPRIMLKSSGSILSPSWPKVGTPLIFQQRAVALKLELLIFISSTSQSVENTLTASERWDSEATKVETFLHLASPGNYSSVSWHRLSPEERDPPCDWNQPSTRVV